ncbi:MAG: lysylphosphatidylglycerol synthase transmembrane domain-containing protein [Alphaproteobacteria bacterium]|nr:lysylphosphatidylglycerol synthase transmembrane domain-containing protein [Alphaproteobacteria bacterium]
MADRALTLDIDQPPKARRVEFAVVLGLVAFVALFAVGSIYAGIGQVWAHLTALPASLILGMLALSLLNYALRAWRWQIFCDGLGLPVPWARNALYFVAGFALTMSPGKAGEAIRLWFLQRCHGYPYERAAPMFIGDRLSDSLAILLLCLAGIGAFAGYAVYALVVAALVLIAILMLARPAPLLSIVLWVWGASGRRQPRLFAKIRHAIRGTRAILSPHLSGVGLILALIGWTAEVLAFQWLVTTLGTEISLQQAAFVFCFAMIAGTIAMLPGGLGGTEATMLALLALLNVPLDQAVVATAVIRLTTLWFATVLGLMVLPATLRLARSRR